jgi:polysaccharide biosynthesis protein PslH
MNLLFVVPYVPTLIRVRPYQFIKALARRGHTLTLATLIEREEERAALDTINSWGVETIALPLSKLRSLWNCAAALPGSDPLQAHFCWQPALAAQIDQLIASRKFDAVHVEHLRGSRYALRIKQRGGPRLIWDSVDSITHLFEQSAQHSLSLPKRLMTQLDLPRTRRFEGMLARHFDHTLVTSRIDREALLALGGAQAAPITVVPNGVDLDAFAPGPDMRTPDMLVFSGKMSYHANVTAVLHFVRAILPGIWQQRPQVTLQIVGKDPVPAVRALAQAHPGKIEVTGSVPALAPYLQRAAVAVVPIVYGAGVQNKVLEAMSTATPVVTSAAAVSALDPAHHAALRVAQDDADFIRHVLALLDNADQRVALGRAGRAFVEQHHNWDRAAETLAGAYAGSRK